MRRTVVVAPSKNIFMVSPSTTFTTCTIDSIEVPASHGGRLLVAAVTELRVTAGCSGNNVGYTNDKNANTSAAAELTVPACR